MAQSSQGGADLLCIAGGKLVARLSGAFGVLIGNAHHDEVAGHDIGCAFRTAVVSDEGLNSTSFERSLMRLLMAAARASAGKDRTPSTLKRVLPLTVTATVPEGRPVAELGWHRRSPAASRSHGERHEFRAAWPRS